MKLDDLMAEVPDDVRVAAENIWRRAKFDLESCLDELTQDMRDRAEVLEMSLDDDSCDGLAFGISLTTMQQETEENGGITPRLHALYLASIYSLARQRVSQEGAKP